MGCSTSKASATPANIIFAVDANTLVTVNQQGLPAEYQLTRPLGSGAFAQVGLYTYAPTQQQRAVKSIHKSGLSREQRDSTFFLKEVQVLKTLDHPNILRCYEIFQDSRQFYVVTEFCDGGELFDCILRRKHFNERDAATLMFQLLSAVSYCHERRVIHRDLKPENILLEDGPHLTIKVADFGSSCFIDRGQKLTGCFGSAYYVAPEVVQGEYNEKCDVWSCGVIMFILLTGRPPYPGRDQRAILEMARTNPLQIDRSLLPGISRTAVDLLQGMLTINVSRRLTAKDALNHAWIKNSCEMQTPSNLETILQNLREFHSSAKLRDAVHMYLSTHVVSHNDLKLLKQAFQAIDANGDGRITQAELVDQYAKTMSNKQARAAAEHIMTHVDSDQSGAIDYSEFLKASTDYSKYLSQGTLTTAFQLFDKDGSGDITAEELRETLADGKLYEDELWQSVLKEVDENGDGVIDLKEFIKLMTPSI